MPPTRHLLAALLCLLPAPVLAQASTQAPAPAARATAAMPTPAATPPLVIVVRHAEKAPAPAGDPPLSAEGRERAAALAATLADAGVSAVIVTTFRRTAETAAPLAAARGLTPEVVPIGSGGMGMQGGMGGGVAGHARAVAAAARRHAGGVVLVVGHSNTVPAIVAALGGPQLPDLCDAAYATMFVVRPTPAGAPAPPAASLVRAHYGRPDAPGAAACATPAMR